MPEPTSPDLDDLFEERSLWQVYCKSRPFYYNRFNRVVAVAGLAVLAAFAAVHFARLPGTTAAGRLNFPELFSTWANTGLSYGGTILGFLLAGFAILFAVFRPQTVLALRQITRPGETHDELKLMFVAFVDVFVHYTAFLFWSVAYLVAGGRNGPFELAGRYLSIMSPWLPEAITHGVFVAWGMWFLVLVLKLKSFIYNLYQALLLGMSDSLG